MKPDLIIMGESDSAPGPGLPAAKWAEGIKTTLERFRKADLPVKYMLDTPFPGFDVPECVANHLSTVRECEFPVAKAYQYPYRRAASITAADEAGATVIDPVAWLCGSSKCPVVVGNILVWRDTGHMTAVYSKWLSPVLGTLLSTKGSPESEPTTAKKSSA
jgi:hypothetical protein